jgi:ferredoxin-like protein FixX
MSQGSLPLGGTASRNKLGVAEQLWKRLMEMCCAHNFSWPHTGVYGQDYQVCVICGVTYAYDLATMRRTERLAQPPTHVGSS